MMDIARQEAALLKIQSDLDSWHSLIPHCVTMSYTTTSGYSFRNNGTKGKKTKCFATDES
jgi:nuclear transport factor 2 (NTF2) superfamily protein